MATLALLSGQLSPSQRELFKRTILGKDFTDDECSLALAICERTGLDPLAKQIYFVKRNDPDAGSKRMVVQTSIDGYRAVAASASHPLAGTDAPIYDEGLSMFECMKDERKNPTVARVTVWKLIDGVKHPFVGEVSWNGYYPKAAKMRWMWDQIPYEMLAKCAEAQACRKGWSTKLSGTYIDEEMHQAEEGAAQTQRQTPQRKVKDATATVTTAKTTESAPANAQRITTPQASRLYAVASKAGWHQDQVKVRLGEMFGAQVLDANKKVTAMGILTDQYDVTVGWFETHKPDGSVVESAPEDVNL